MMADRDDPRQRRETDEAEPIDSPSSAEARLSALETELEAARVEARQADERWRRELADADNLKKRLAREKADAVRFGTEALVRDLLPIVDNLERAVDAARGGGNGKPLVEGVELVLKGLHDVLERHGVTRVPAPGGAPFDPTHHEAVAHIPSEHDANAIVAEHQRGYRLHDRLLRPALVSVSKGRA